LDPTALSFPISSWAAGPLLDCNNLHIEVPAVKFRAMTSEVAGETSAPVRDRLVAERHRQQARSAPRPRVTCKARLGPKELKAHCALDDATLEPLRMAMTQMSARAYDLILKVARTIANLAGAERISSVHICEAITYRSLDRQIWGLPGWADLDSYFNSVAAFAHKLRIQQ
jgi:magnesium chelatase family protein